MTDQTRKPMPRTDGPLPTLAGVTESAKITALMMHRVKYAGGISNEEASDVWLPRIWDAWETTECKRERALLQHLEDYVMEQFITDEG